MTRRPMPLPRCVACDAQLPPAAPHPLCVHARFAHGARGSRDACGAIRATCRHEVGALARVPSGMWDDCAAAPLCASLCAPSAAPRRAQACAELHRLRGSRGTRWRARAPGTAARAAVMALAAPDFGELSGLSLDERFLNEAGLLWSSGGEEETESARAWPALDAFAPSGGAPLDAPMEDEPAVSALSLRCIDPSHAPHCTRCAARVGARCVRACAAACVTASRAPPLTAARARPAQLHARAA
jgi:hypothetical protein